MALREFGCFSGNGNQSKPHETQKREFDWLSVIAFLLGVGGQSVEVADHPFPSSFFTQSLEGQKVNFFVAAVTFR